MTARGHGIGSTDLHLFNEGTHRRLWEVLGARLAVRGEVAGATFAVWAPAASAVSVVGDFNDWRPDAHGLSPMANSGIWQGFVPGARVGQCYKLRIVSSDGATHTEKADPLGFFHERPPRTASVLWSLEYEWGDGEWMATRGARNALDAPMSIYEVHLGSWMRMPEEDGRSLRYREIAPRMARYAREQGYTHVELMPVMEHPFAGSWGYQITGFFAPTARFGTPQDFMYLVDTLHQHGLGVVLDWVPAHFPTDAHGLGMFDGTHLFEHADPRRGFHPDWTTFIFNYGRHEVRSFLISSALFWLGRYHADALRVDGVASMLYLDYSRPEGEWIPNALGGRENLDAIHFLKRLNEAVYEAHPDVQMIAEESTAWPGVSRPTSAGGLGFGLKWDMGWMHDTLAYLEHDPVHRRHHHDQITFRALYAFDENFVLPLSHDEVVHGKGSLLDKVPGNDWQRFANLRLLYGYMWGAPGKKLLFMGCELAQRREWDHDSSIDWHLADTPAHGGVQRLVAELNRLLRERRALHELDHEPGGFRWTVGDDFEQSVLAFTRHGRNPADVVLVVLNFTPVPRPEYRVGVDIPGPWTVLLNTDEERFGGSGQAPSETLATQERAAHGRPHSLALVLPPLGALWLAPSGSTQ